jgi:pyrimidodiazepine synthase
MQVFFSKSFASFFRYDVVNINLQEKPEWYFLKNPLGKVPALETESGDCIYESLIIADYLDEIYPQTPLHSRDSMQKAKDRILIERFGSVCIVL